MLFADVSEAHPEQKIKQDLQNPAYLSFDMPCGIYRTAKKNIAH